MYGPGRILVNQAGDAIVFGFTPGFQTRDLQLLNEILDETISQGHKLLIVDMANISLANSPAVFPFLRRWHELRQRGGDIRLCGLSTRIRNALDLLNVDRIPDVYHSIEEALHTPPLARSI